MKASTDSPSLAAVHTAGEEIEFGTVEEACRIIGGKENPIHAASYYRGVKRGDYPAPIRVSPNVSRVPLAKLRTCLRAMIEAA